jgi:hypothetical protein
VYIKKKSCKINTAFCEQNYVILNVKTSISNKHSAENPRYFNCSVLDKSLLLIFCLEL